MEMKTIKDDDSYMTYWKNMARQVVALEELTKKSFEKKECRKCGKEAVEGTDLCDYCTSLKSE